LTVMDRKVFSIEKRVGGRWSVTVNLKSPERVALCLGKVAIKFSTVPPYNTILSLRLIGVKLSDSRRNSLFLLLNLKVKMAYPLPTAENFPFPALLDVLDFS